MERNGIGFTTTLEIATFDEIQPSELVPVTEYEVFVAGLTVAEPLLKE
jgi:hypothetical protein